jgi:anti-sigma regulatory factor (Ser/Thr protein kinase)
MSGGTGTAQRQTPSLAVSPVAPRSVPGAGPAFQTIRGRAAGIDLGLLPQTPTTARKWAQSVVCAWGVRSQDAEEIALVVSELVTNAVRATLSLRQEVPTPILLRLSEDMRRNILIEVADAHPQPPAPRDPGDDENGRGLLIVGTLALNWGGIPAAERQDHLGAHAPRGRHPMNAARLAPARPGLPHGDAAVITTDSGSAEAGARAGALFGRADLGQDAVARALGRAFPRWLFWADELGWHARRNAGCFWARLSDPGVRAYSLTHPSVLVLLLLVDVQDQMDRPGADEDTASGVLTVQQVRSLRRALKRVLWPDPMLLVRDIMAARLAAEFPGALIGYAGLAWTATPLDDDGAPAGEPIQTESAPSLAGILRVRQAAHQHALPGAAR